jgi:hypothetical protein
MADVKISITAEDGTQQVFSAVRESGKTALDSVSNSAVDSTGKMKSAFDGLKTHWLTITAEIYAAWHTVSKAIELISLGAMAMQSEESFKNVTKAYSEDADQLLAKMKQVSAGIIDDSNLMQRAVKGMQQGLSGNQIVKLLEVSRSAARIAGTDIASAFDGITNSVANLTVRGLKAYGIVIDQSQANEDYAEAIGKSKDALNEQEQAQALANAVIKEGSRQMGNMGEITKNAAERIQEAEAKIHELKEIIGKGLIEVLGKAIEHSDSLAVALTAGAIVAAVPMLVSITKALRAVEIAALQASMAVRSIGVGIAAAVGYEMGKMLDEFVYKLTSIDLSGTQEEIAELIWLKEELAKRQEKVKKATDDESAALKEDKEAVKAINEAVTKYGDVLKDVGADVLKFAGDDFTRNLKSQEKSIGGMTQALSGYLNVTDEVYNTRLQMLSVLDQEVDMEIQNTAMQKAQAEARLGAWSQYYIAATALHTQAIDAQKKKSDELLQVERDIRQARMSTDDLVLSIQQKTMSASEKYFSTTGNLEAKYNTAMQLSGGERINMLKSIQQAWSGLTDDVKDGGIVLVSAASAQATAINHIQEIGNSIINAEMEKKAALEAEAAAWKDIEGKSSTAMVKASEMMELYINQIRVLGKAISDMDTDIVLKVDSSQAMMEIDRVKAILKTINDIPAVKKVVFDNTGTGSDEKPIMDKLAEIRGGYDALEQTRVHSTHFVGYGSSGRPIMDKIGEIETALGSMTKSSAFSMDFSGMTKFLSGMRTEFFSATHDIHTRERKIGLGDPFGYSITYDQPSQQEMEAANQQWLTLVDKVVGGILGGGSTSVPVVQQGSGGGDKNINITFNAPISLNGYNKTPEELAKEIVIPLKLELARLAVIA